MAWSYRAVVVALVIVLEVSSHEYPTYYNDGRDGARNDPNVLQYIADKEHIQQIHSMIDAYRGDIDGRMVIETNALIDTKYRTWKRNADLINSLLALPKGMNDAGR